MQNRHSRDNWREHKAYGRPARRDFDSTSSYGSRGSYSSYDNQDEPYDRAARYSAEHDEHRYDITPRSDTDRYADRERIADRYRGDHDLSVSRTRYDNETYPMSSSPRDYEYNRDFTNRTDYANRDYDNRSYQSTDYTNRNFEGWSQPRFSAERTYGQSGLYGGGRPDRYYRNSRSEEKHGVMDDIKSFFGMGPKNYKRSDERIREDINEALTYDHDLDASHIDVLVRDAVVTLTGTVTQRSAKRLAEDLAEKVRGVSDVKNELQVKNVMQDDFGTPISSTEKTKNKNAERLT